MCEAIIIATLTILCHTMGEDQRNVCFVWVHMWVWVKGHGTCVGMGKGSPWPCITSKWGRGSTGECSMGTCVGMGKGSWYMCGYG